MTLERNRHTAVVTIASSPVCVPQVQNWTETLSGGEKQRLAMARLVSWGRAAVPVQPRVSLYTGADLPVRITSSCLIHRS